MCTSVFPPNLCLFSLWRVDITCCSSSDYACQLELSTKIPRLSSNGEACLHGCFWYLLLLSQKECSAAFKLFALMILTLLHVESSLPSLGRFFFVCVVHHCSCDPHFKGHVLNLLSFPQKPGRAHMFTLCSYCPLWQYTVENNRSEDNKKVFAFTICELSLCHFHSFLLIRLFSCCVYLNASFCCIAYIKGTLGKKMF